MPLRSTSESQTRDIVSRQAGTTENLIRSVVQVKLGLNAVRRLIVSLLRYIIVDAQNARMYVLT